MDAIASQGLAIGLDLGKHVFTLVAMLSLLGLRGGRGVELGFELPSFRLKLKVWPDTSPEKAAPQEMGSADDLNRSARALLMTLEKILDNQQQVDSRGN